MPDSVGVSIPGTMHGQHLAGCKLKDATLCRTPCIILGKRTPVLHEQIGTKIGKQKGSIFLNGVGGSKKKRTNKDRGGRRKEKSESSRVRRMATREIPSKSWIFN